MSDSERNTWRVEPPAPPSVEVPAPALIECWRCGKFVEADLARCPFCAAALSHQANSQPTELEAVSRQSRTIARTMAVFAFLLGTSVVAGLFNRAVDIVGRPLPVNSRTALVEVLILEGIDTVAVLAALAWVGLAWREPRRTASRRILAWTLCIPLLGVALVLNLQYHQFLIDWLKVVPVEQIVAKDRPALPFWAVAICIQPAVIEELFFRYLAFAALRPVMGGSAAVWITAAMFALAHIGAPLSLPILFMLGLLLGYARLGSGGVLLPMFLHCVHNAVVLAWQTHLL